MNTGLLTEASKFLERDPRDIAASEHANVAAAPRSCTKLKARENAADTRRRRGECGEKGSARVYSDFGNIAAVDVGTFQQKRLPEGKKGPRS